jgi:polyribonucleotide nucleotidyltransferase
MKVLVIDIDDHDRVKLSRRRALEELGIKDDLPPRAASEDGENPDRERDRDSDRDRGGERDRGGDRGDRGGDRGGGGRSRRSGGGGGRPRR